MLEIIMLPTNESSQIFSEFGSEIPQFGVEGLRDFHQNQFLYLVDASLPIFERNPVLFWKLDDRGGYTINPEVILAKSLGESLAGKYEKIIATNDPSLGLPSFYDSFLENYCKNPHISLIKYVYVVGRIEQDGGWSEYLEFNRLIPEIHSYQEALDICQLLSCDAIRVDIFTEEELVEEDSQEIVEHSNNSSMIELFENFRKRSRRPTATDTQSFVLAYQESVSLHCIIGSIWSMLKEGNQLEQAHAKWIEHKLKQHNKKFKPE